MLAKCNQPISAGTMSTVWFSADLHFGHSNIIKYCDRPFLSEEERAKAAVDPRGRCKVSAESVRQHDDALLDAINSLVMPDDQFWILGDFCLGKHKDAKKYVDRIKCKNLNFVWGNHDHPSIGPLFQKTMQQGLIKVKGQSIALNHYPLRSWDKRFHGSWSLYGHVHGRLSKFDAQNPALLTRDVGVDACEYCPISFEQLQAWMEPRLKAFREMKQRIIDGVPLASDSLD